MLDWDNLRIFLAAVRAGNYSAAAHLLHVNRTTVGRRLERLEHQLGITLFEQGEDGYHPTAAGRRALEVADEVTRLMTGLTEELKNHDLVARRKLRLAMPSDLGSELMPQISAFLKAHGDIDVTILSTAHPAESVVQRKSDICLCLADRQPDHLRGLRLGSLQQAGYAALGYLDKRGHDLAPQDYEWVRYSGWSQVPALRRWDDFFSDAIPVATRVDNWHALRSAVECELGAGFMWTFVASSYANLVQIVPLDEALSIDLWVMVRDDVPIDPDARKLMNSFEASIAEVIRR
jgi:DNA-binding transcriptional LysR family regulator